MTPLERRATLSIASIYSFRMLGLFMILPVFSIYAHTLPHTTPFLIGLALGIYGLTQALLQIPFGMTSDKIGRKPVIAFGLVVFALGSIVAAIAHGIHGIIIGRALQGAGAIGSTLTAMVADSTEEDQRLKAMAMIGMTIGLSFMFAMVIGPLLNGWIGISGIFWLTSGLAILGIILLFTLVPTPPYHFLHRDTEPVLSQFSRLLTNAELLRLDFGVFSQHAILTASFIALPLFLLTTGHLTINQQWWVYLPVLISSFIAMVPFIILAEKKHLMKPLFIGAITLLTLTQILLWYFHQNVFIIALLLFFFFTPFTFLEACLPSLIAKIAPAGNKGSAMGIYSSSQFLGIFVGGSAGGWIYHQFGLTSIFGLTGLLGFLWLIAAITMQPVQYLSSMVVKIGLLNSADAAKVLELKLLAVSGVAEAKIYRDEQVAYLKVDKRLLNESWLNELIEESHHVKR